MVGIGLLLVCVYVMSLQFARTDERRRELMVRLAFGGSRRRIVGELLMESVVLALAGGLLGLAMYRPAAAAIVSLVTDGGDPIRLSLTADSTALLYVLGISIAAALFCGIAPAVRATNPKRT